MTSVANAQQRSFAFSDQWRALLHYRKTTFKNQSRAFHQEFFLSQTGSKDLEKEYQANLFALNQDPDYRCRFPARATVLQEHSNKEHPLDLSECLELNEWMDSLGHDEISVLFAGAYANNPASLFGHTFLKFSKTGRNPLLDYVVAFLARTDPRDSAPVYTWKGLTGGYLGFFEIEHYSMSIGLYNNSESRDIWEYSLPLSESQRKLIAYHLWEIINHTGFSYYFGDENCSFLLLALLEVAIPDAKLTAKPPVFVMPIETVKQLKHTLEDFEFRHYRRSLQSQINDRLKTKETNFIKDYVKIQKERNLAHYENDVEMLDVLIDTYHLKNYREKTNLSFEDQEFMYMLLRQRSQLHNKSPALEPKEPSRPELSHAPRRLRTMIDDESAYLELSYGLHRLIEPAQGYEDFSYIDFFVLEGSYQKKTSKIQLERFTLVDISSWEPVSLANAALSWQVKAESLKKDEVFNVGSLLHIKGGPGLAYTQTQWGSALFVGADMKMVYRDQQTRVLPYLEWQSFYRPKFLQRFSTAIFLRHFAHETNSQTELEVELAWHLDRNFSIGVYGDIEKWQSGDSRERLMATLTYRF